MVPDPLHVFNPVWCDVTDVHAGFVHVRCEGAAAGQTPPAAPDSQVSEQTLRLRSVSTAPRASVQGSDCVSP